MPAIVLGLLLWATFAHAAEAPRAPDYALLEHVLQRYVREDGTVDYRGIRADPGKLTRFTSQIASVGPDRHPTLFPSREAKLAYWINAYNATVLQVFANEYPEKRLQLTRLLGRARFFYKAKHVFGGVPRSLDDIESNSMRKGLKEPRIHFAIVCASASCPWLSREAYRPEKLEAQLEAAASKYFSQSRNFRFDGAKRELWLPEIFDWFRQDWGGNQGVLRFVGKYRQREASRLLAPGVRIRYFPYDWSPNDR